MIADANRGFGVRHLVGRDGVMVEAQRPGIRAARIDQLAQVCAGGRIIIRPQLTGLKVQVADRHIAAGDCVTIRRGAMPLGGLIIAIVRNVTWSIILFSQTVRTQYPTLSPVCTIISPMALMLLVTSAMERIVPWSKITRSVIRTGRRACSGRETAAGGLSKRLSRSMASNMKGGTGNFVQWFSPNAFGGTYYSNTPVGAISTVAEPNAEVGNSAIYFGLWVSGKNFAACAWNAAQSDYFQAVGDPFVQQ
jgi:hypothetical protein